MMIDERADRFRPLLNDEYGNLFLGELVGYISCPSQRLHDYTMMQHTDAPTRSLSYIPYSILEDDDYAPHVGPMRPGSSSLPVKNDRYRTSQGVLTLDEYMRRMKAFVPTVCRPELRHVCADTVKYAPESAAVNALFRHEQRNSRLLKDAGAGLRREDIEARRAKA